MQRTHRVAVGLVAVAMVSTGCFGSFNLTRKLYRWNDEISQDKWAKEFVFLVLVWVPVYSLAGLGDAIVFNSIEFWTGKNPIEPATEGRASQAQPAQTRRIVRKDTEAILRRVVGAEGEELLIEQFQHGQPVGGLRIRQVGGVSVASSMDGRTLFKAQTLPDGSLVVSDPEGKPVAFYSVQEVERRMASSARQ